MDLRLAITGARIRNFFSFLKHQIPNGALDMRSNPVQKTTGRGLTYNNKTDTNKKFVKIN